MSDTKLPDGLDDFLTSDDPQSDLAAQGFGQLGQMALNSEPVQNAITGKGLKDFYDMAGKAAQRDPQAMQQLANHSAGIAMGSMSAEVPPQAEGLIGKAKQMFPEAKTFEDLYKFANDRLHPGHPIMQAVQQVKNRKSGLNTGGEIAFAEGGEVPEGLDAFLSGPQSSPMGIAPTTTTPNQTRAPAAIAEMPPDGIDEFIAPELKEDTYGTPSQQLIAGLEGAAQGVAGPLAPMAEKALGVKEEDILGRAEINPGTHYASEIAGLVAPALVSGGTSVLAKAAGFTQAAALEKATAQIASKLGLGAAETLAGKLGAAGAKGAIENAMLVGSDEVSRLVLNDPNQSTSTAIVDVGLAATLGGVLGAAGAGLSPLWKASVGDKASKFIEDFNGRVNEHLTNPEPVAAMTDELSKYYKSIKEIADDVHGANGLKAQNIAKAVPLGVSDSMAVQMATVSDKVEKALMKMEKDSHVNLLQDAFDKYKQGTINADSPGAIFNATQEFKQQLQEWGKYNKKTTPLNERLFRDASKALARDLRVVLEDSKVWGKAADVQKGVNRALSGTVEGDIEAGLAKNVGYISALNDFENKFTTAVGGDKVIDPAKINTYLNQLGKPTAEIKQTMLKNFLDASEKYKTEIHNLHTNLGLETPVVNTPMNVTMGSLNQKTLGGRIADAFLNKALAGNVAGGAIGAQVGHTLAHQGELGAILGVHALGPFFSSVLPAIAKSIVKFGNNSESFKASVDYVTQVVKGEALLNKATKNVFKYGSAILPEAIIPRERDLEKLNKLFDKMRDNPDQIMNGNQPLGHYMPDHNSALNTTAAKAMQYASSLRPDKNPAAPLDSPPKPNAAQKATYTNALMIAQQPLVVLDKIQKGTITPDDLKALVSIYPDLYSRLKDKVTQNMVDHMSKGGTIPYKTRIGLSMFLGQPLDSTMTPQALQSIQGRYLGSAQAPQQPGSRQQSHGVKSSPALQKMPNLYQTPGQARLQYKTK